MKPRHRAGFFNSAECLLLAEVRLPLSCDGGPLWALLGLLLTKPEGLLSTIAASEKRPAGGSERHTPDAQMVIPAHGYLVNVLTPFGGCTCIRNRV